MLKPLIVRPLPTLLGAAFVPLCWMPAAAEARAILPQERISEPVPVPVSVPAPAPASPRPGPSAPQPALPPEARAGAVEGSEDAEEEEEEVIIVEATRSGRRVQDEAIRVEVMGREEIEEKIMMTPGNISMIVAETPGVRVQVTSPALGSSNVRMQGMSGRYTQLLSDGLPLFGGQPSSIGLMQIPPTDLGQVEIIKGAASALYGPSALGGVINLVSKRPKSIAEGEVLLNATTRNGQDATFYGAVPLGSEWGLSLTGGYHQQRRQDLDKDGWIDMAGYDRWTLRPRLFWQGDSGGKAFLTLGVSDERRQGGTLEGKTMPDGQPFTLTRDTRRFDAGMVSEFPLDGLGKLHLRASATTQRHRQSFGPSRENARTQSYFAETSLSGDSGGTNWVAGAAFQTDDYHSKDYPAVDYHYRTPAIFAQVEQEMGDALLLAGSARVDFHNVYGTRLSPRLSLLYRPGVWTVRASLGQGFYAPTPFVDAIEAAGVARLIVPDTLKAETAKTGSLDFGYAKGPLEASVTLFGSDIDHAVQLRDVDKTHVTLVNASGITRTRGGEAMLRYRWNDIVLRGSYVFVDASEPEPGLGPGPGGAGRRAVPGVPKHSAGFIAMWEKHGRGRIGFETYYTGRQPLDDNPYRTRGKPYVEMGMLAEITLGKVSLFINAENILDVRQTKYNPLVRRIRNPAGAWTVDAWAPTDGFVLNGGIRMRFGGA